MRDSDEIESHSFEYFIDILVFFYQLKIGQTVLLIEKTRYVISKRKFFSFLHLIKT